MILNHYYLSPENLLQKVDYYLFAEKNKFINKSFFFCKINIDRATSFIKFYKTISKDFLGKDILDILKNIVRQIQKLI